MESFLDVLSMEFTEIKTDVHRIKKRIEAALQAQQKNEITLVWNIADASKS